ncbi:iron permease FTR1 [Phlebopus sp. FC_14]|nr:iron permease FTR1 [Phlebopus sp. FC_14]
MSQDLFSVTIFFVVFRETLEAAVIVSVLLGLVEQIFHDDPNRIDATLVEQTRSMATARNNSETTIEAGAPHANAVPEDPVVLPQPRLLRKLRLQIYLGTLVGLVFAVAMGAAFIAVWFTQAKDLWSKSEQLWEGIFQLIASLMIFLMGLTMLKMDRAKVKWRIKLERAFSGKRVDRSTRTGKWILFILPFVTVLREGIEAVVFVGGVALGEPASSIPIAAIVGIICGLICGFLIYQFASRTALRVFLVCMTNLLLLIGSGLFSKSVWAFQQNAWNNLIGTSADEAGGNGPGSYDVRGNVWHLDCCSPAPGTGDGWSIFNAILGWQNSATLGSVLSYVFYWLAVIVVLVGLKFKEGRTKLIRWESAAGKRRCERRQEAGRQTTVTAVPQEKEGVESARDNSEPR